jgi:hypothetical protein
MAKKKKKKESIMKNYLGNWWGSSEKNKLNKIKKGSKGFNRIRKVKWKSFINIELWYEFQNLWSFQNNRTVCEILINE